MCPCMLKVPKTTSLQNLNGMLDYLDSWYVYKLPCQGNGPRHVSIKDYYKWLFFIYSYMKNVIRDRGSSNNIVVFFFVESPYKIATTESSQVFIQVYTILYKFESMKLYPRFKFWIIEKHQNWLPPVNIFAATFNIWHFARFGTICTI